MNHTAFESTSPLANQGSTRLFSYCALPIQWAVNVGYAVHAVATGANLAFIPLLLLVFNVLYLTAVERLLTYDRRWHSTLREWLGGAGYFTINMIASLFFQAGIAALTIALATGESGWPLWLEIPLSFLAITFIGYWVHRWLHTHSWAWKVHSVHHNPTKQNMWFTNYTHFVEILLIGATIQLPLLIMGISAEAVVLVNSFLAAQSFATHCNADVRLGWLEYVFTSPQQHRLHHSQDLDEAGNYGSFIPLWDLLFGTFTWRPGKKPERVGIAGSTLPPPEAVLRNTAYPFRGLAR